SACTRRAGSPNVLPAGRSSMSQYSCGSMSVELTICLSSWHASSASVSFSISWMNALRKCAGMDPLPGSTVTRPKQHANATETNWPDKAREMYAEVGTLPRGLALVPDRALPRRDRSGRGRVRHDRCHDRCRRAHRHDDLWESDSPVVRAPGGHDHHHRHLNASQHFMRDLSS